MPKSKVIFVCSSCGNESPKWLGKCPACGSWNSFYEEKVTISKGSNTTKLSKEPNKPIALNDVENTKILRTSTGFAELDRVLRRRDCFSVHSY